MTTYSKIVMSICALTILSLFTYFMLYKGSVIVAVNAPVTPTTTATSSASSTPSKATSTPPKPITPAENTGSFTLQLRESKNTGDIEITPEKIVEDSRCPIGVQCIQAGRVRAEVTIKIAAVATVHTLLIGEPLITDKGIVTLTAVSPIPTSGVEVKESDYRLTFKATAEKITYKNASANIITVETPLPGAVTGRSFQIKGNARGQWFFEATSKVTVLDKAGNKLAESTGRPEGDALTENFVPFNATVTIPETYSGPATIVLANDNPSGLHEHDSSMSFPITIAE